MNSYYIKNILRIGISTFLHLLLLFICTLLVIVASKSYLDDLSNNYEDYKYIRGIEKYSESVKGFLTSEVGDEIVYTYTLGSVNYTYTLNKSSVTSVDKEIDILYDILEPENSITKKDIKNAPNFYTEALKDLGYLYLVCLITILVTGILWYFVNRFKYSMCFWKSILVG